MGEAEIEMGDLSAAADDAGVDVAAEASRGASDNLATETEQDKDQQDTADKEGLDNYIEGTGDTPPKNTALKTAADNLISKAKDTLAKLTKAFQKFNPKANIDRLNFKDNFDPNKVGKDVADANQDVMDRIGKGVEKTVPDPVDAAEKFEKAADEETDSTKRARYKLYRTMAKLLAAGLIAGGFVDLLIKLADSMTGCYEIVIKGGTGQNILICGNSDKTLSTNCTCNVLTNKAETLLTSPTPGNNCAIDSSHTCDPSASSTYSYVYKKVYWWDVLSDIVTHLQQDYEDIFGGNGIIQKTLNWLESHWWVILLIVCVPILLTLIIKLTSKKNNN